MITSLLLLAGAIWMAGKERWQIQQIATEKNLTTEEIPKIEEILQAQNDEVVSQFNLGALNLQQQKFKEAKEILSELLNANQADEKIVKKLLFNLGNASFRLSEQEQDLSKALILLKESLTYYRAIIEKEKQDAKYSSTPFSKDEDAHYNYVLTRQRIKVLQDKLAQQQKEQANNKELYQLLKELRAKEAVISEQLKKMESDPFSEASLKIREELLRQHGEHLKQLAVIKEKMKQLLTPQQAPLANKPPVANI